MLLTRSCPCATKMQKQNPFCGKHSIQSRRSLRARGAFDPSDFRRSFNPIPTWEGRLGPPHYYLTHQIFRPSYGLVILSSLCAARATPWKMVVKDFHLLFSVKILDLLLSVCITHWIIFCWKYYWSYFISTRCQQGDQVLFICIKKICIENLSGNVEKKQKQCWI